MTDLAAAGALMAREIAEQPRVWERILDEAPRWVADLTTAINRYAPTSVQFLARGTSDHAALYAKYLIEIGWRLPAGSMSPSVFTAYGARPEMSGVLVVAISQSGRSPDLVSTLETCRDQGALTIAVTNKPSSELARAAELHVDVLAGPELAVAATKSYTAQLLTLYLLLGGAPDAAESLPGLAREVLSKESDVALLAQRYRFARRMVTVARGYSYATAREAALKLMETAYVSAQAFSGADLLHGPLAMIDEDVPVLATVGHGQGGNSMEPVLSLLDARGADVRVVGRGGTIDLPVPAHETLSPLLEILPFQQLARSLALARGVNPDAPRGLLKETQTL